MKQPRIAVLEDVNHDAWTLKTLKRLAEVFDVRVSLKFESFGSLVPEFERFSRETLRRPAFADDPAFQTKEPEEETEGLVTVPAKPEAAAASFRSIAGTAEAIARRPGPRAVNLTSQQLSFDCYRGASSAGILRDVAGALVSSSEAPARVTPLPPQVTADSAGAIQPNNLSATAQAYR
jgi:hypothetical protein